MMPFIDNKKYFTYDDCDIKGDHYCQGMASFDLVDIQDNILLELQIILNSDDFQEIIENNHIMTNKTISYNDITQALLVLL